jgi:hypothetical protein
MAWSPLPEDEGAQKAATKTLLAVDLGLRAGLALFGDDGRLICHRATHFPDRSRMRRALPNLMASHPNLDRVLAEGDAHLYAIWRHAAHRQGVGARRIQAEDWRRDLLGQRSRQASQYKSDAIVVARQIIVWSGLKKPISLGHDAAEAICIGLWGVWQAGWIGALPTLTSTPRQT